DDCACRRRDDSDHPRQERELALACLAEQTLCGELLLALLEQRHERTDAGRLQHLNDDLIARGAWIGGDAAGGDDLEALRGLALEARNAAAPNHGLDLRLVVLEGEVAVAGRVRAAEPRDFAPEPHE